MGSTGCRKQAAAIMRDGRDRVRSIFSISREWSPYYSGEEAVEGSARLFDSRRGLRLLLPFILVPIPLLFLSLVSQPGSLLVKIQFVAAHRMENKKKRPLNWRYVMAAT